MKTGTVKNALEAHGWVGLFISVPLFIVFWAGAVTLFYPEVQRWSAMPHFPLTQQNERIDLSTLLEKKIAEHDVDPTHPISIYLPSDHSPYLNLELPVHPTHEGDDTGDEDHHHRHLMIDPVSGETLSQSEPFQLANFLNRLHFSLKLPQGLYLVGIVTFFFLVLVFTGILIQLRNLVKNFFLYRHQKPIRPKMNDLHTVVGVISLPYGLMYALTGVMFNLSIIFQITTVMMLYQGDMQTMMQDAGFDRPTSSRVEVIHEMPDLDTLLQQVATENNLTVRSVHLENYGDAGALIGFSGLENGSFSRSVDRYYQVASDTFPDALNPDQPNLFMDGVTLLFSLHMANFAGVDLRLLYFLLAIGVCAMIVAGNVLWMAKRQQASYSRINAVMRGLTLGGTMGAVVATAVAFFLERALPVDLLARADWMMSGFGITLLLAVLLAYVNPDYKRYLANSCLLTAAVLLLTVSLDVFNFSTVIVALWQSGYVQVAAVSMGLFLSAVLMAWLGLRLLKTSQSAATAHN
ncbi:iron-regulated membrane protein [Methylophaga frappieri]|uniref:Iron-regulated membrane protein n=1 Tax=Methylophaga frappieri (strain ATCC BAA-2434 / DSM 25690 / JAM7) TaxID=754477 RepID=I1YJ51_METFJ|nr:PepSY-associated TM helix domain-containing protein [Methylophaga frappieri]AFJ02944.1 iron-regulated membrane protein [Methylophaga frappieri]